MKGYIILICVILSIQCMADKPPREGYKGKCPRVDVFKEFTPPKMVGKWNIIYEFGTLEGDCAAWEIEQLTPDYYKAHLVHQNVSSYFTASNPNSHGEKWSVKAKNKENLDSSNIQCFGTDYENFAGVYICKEEGDLHYPTFQFWSRTSTLSDENLGKLKALLAKYNFYDESKLHQVNHSSCPQ